MSKLTVFVSGEDVLKYIPNGGTAVSIRSLWASAWIYLIGLSILLATEYEPVYADFYEQLKVALHETVAWFGAIFAAIYIALYTRFSSQWTYIADLYNQQMNAGLLRDSDDFHDRTYDRWRAALIEDAIIMGLDKKDGISTLVYHLLQEPGVREALDGEPVLKEKSIESYAAWFDEKFERSVDQHSDNESDADNYTKVLDEHIRLL